MIKPLKQKIRNLYFEYFGGKKNKKGVVFVIGTGRSGTNMLCACLNKFPSLNDYFGGRESPWMFSHISDITVRERRLPKSVLGYYEYMQNKVYPNLFLDQTHPNIWHVEQLLEQFPNSKFVAIYRNVYSVVFSMKKHEGVTSWIKNHKEYPKPNRFMGVRSEQISIYENQLTDIQRSVFRWCSHMDRIDELISKYSDSVIAIEYESLSGNNMQDQMKRLSRFLGVEPPSEYIQFNTKSLYKKDNLTLYEKKQINEAIRIYGLENNFYKPDTVYMNE